MGIEIAILVALLLLSGFFSGAEVALVSLSRIRARQMVEKKKPGAEYVIKLKKDPQRMLSAILIGNNVANVGASALMTSIMINMFSSYAVGIATGVMTLLILVFGEITPKSIASSNSELYSRLVAPPIWYLSVVLTPAIYLLRLMLVRLHALFGNKQSKGITEEDIITMVKVAEEEGGINRNERTLIRNIFEFDEMPVSKIITPRSDMVMISADSGTKEAWELLTEEKLSRMPVFDKSPDKIVGILYVKDLISHVGKNKNKKVSQIMRKPYFVPDAMKISKLLKQFQKKKIQMAIVIDEHGSIDGLVTLEDIIEEIVGEIMDETEMDEFAVEKTGKNSWKVSGKAPIEEVNNKIDMKIKPNGYETISGFVLENLGKIPIQGDTLDHDNFQIQVLEVEGNRISEISVNRSKKK